ncbi:uncharacterized protein [Spinacia oleracea]|uniref:Uncharacterized protein n=1 Tax=Spinacia oleracea TaxID=3562 RepID=A0A9R0JUS2_SPIOL|nr:uncharacterized protein LOC110787478 [Spinacia oleracea]
MGGCSSSQKNPDPENSSKLPTSKVIKVIHLGGRVKEFDPAICADQILSCNPGCFLCSSDSMFIGSCPENVGGPEELQPGYLYFLLSNSVANKALSLHDLCELAIKATTNCNDNNLSVNHVKHVLSFRDYAVV